MIGLRSGFRGFVILSAVLCRHLSQTSGAMMAKVRVRVSVKVKVRVRVRVRIRPLEP